MSLVAGSATMAMNGSPRLPGTHSDGVEYTTAAESLVTDGSFTIPVTHWSDPDSTTLLSHYPPGFSMAVAVPMALFRLPADRAVEWVLAAGAALTAGVTFWVASGVGGVWAGWIAALLFVSTPAIFKLHIAVWSEALYMGIAMLGLWTIVAAPRRHLLHGMIAAAGVAVRYVGVAGTLVAVWFALATGSGVRSRLRAALSAGVPSAAVVLGWQLHVGGGSEEIRTLGIYPGVLGQTRDIVFLLADWVVPVTLARIIPAWILVLVIPVAMVALMYGGWPRGEGGSEGRVGRGRSVFLLFAAAYSAVVILSRMLLDPLIPFDARLFAPVLLVVTISFAACVVERGRRWTNLLAAGLFVPLAGWMTFGVLDLREIVRVSAVEGRYYTHATWVTWGDDSAVGWAFHESGDYPWLYSNEAAMVYHYGGRTAKHLVRLEEDREAFVEAFRLRPGPVLVTLPGKKVDTPPAEFVELLELRLFRSTEHAELYLPAGSPELRH